MLKQAVTILNKKTFYKLSVIGLFLLAFILRLVVFDKPGGDYDTYKAAMLALHQGENPYYDTVLSFSLPGKYVEHGYAYFPTLMYIQYAIWLLSNYSGVIISTVILWKIPVLIADFLIAYLILSSFRGEKPTTIKEYILRLTILGFWLLNPYFIARFDYSLHDPLFMLFLFYALMYLEKDSVKSGFFYAVAISLKLIPFILFPLFIIKTPDKKKFMAVGFAVFILISIPFMRSVDDFKTYLTGSFIVHSEREIQGRPIISMITHYLYPYGINLMQQDYERVYSYIASLSAMLIPLLLYIKKKINNKYLWSAVAFSIYLLLTPILSRSHILWIIPWFLLVFYEQTRKKIRGVFILLIIWVVLFVYLFSWDRGLVNPSELGGRPELPKSTEQWELPRLVKHKYYETRGWLLDII